MQQQPISLQPEILQFTANPKQLLKIINRTNEAIPNCFFCLYNTSKYEFAPESFRLEPWEHRLVTVTLLNKKSECKPKEFAYVKSKNFSKRITFLHGEFQDQGIMRSPSSGVEDLYTLSSRDYRETQKAAYDRVIAEKEAYIKRLERRLEEQEESNRKDRSFTSESKPKPSHAKQLEQLQQKILQTTKQKQAALAEAHQCRQKIKQLESLLIRGSTSSQKSEQMDEIQKIIKRKDEAIVKLREDLNFMEVQCESLYVTISEKEEKIRKYELKNSEMVNELMKENEKRLKDLETKIDQEKKKNEKESRSYRDKVKKLEDKLSQSQVRENRVGEYEQELEKKQKELAKLESKLEQQKRKRKQYEQDKKKAFKAQLQNESLLEENSILKSKVEGLEKSVEDLREQTIIYRSKVVEEPDRASRYLEVALESCRNENQILKKSRKEIEQSLAEETRSRKIYENKTHDLQLQIKELQEHINRIRAQKQQLQARSRMSRDESHQTILKLRAQNIDLIQKMSVNPKPNPSIEHSLNQSRLQLQKSEEELKKIRKESEEQIKKIKGEYETVFSRLKEVQDDKMKMSRKMEKYKKQTRKELEDIAQGTLGELKKVKEEKKKLMEKVAELEKTINESKEKKLDSTLQNMKNDTKSRYPACQSDRRTGIKNQRREIEQTFNSYSRNQEIQSMYSELGELRQFKNYISIEMKKLKDTLGIRENSYGTGESQSLIFNCVSIFDSLRSKLNEQMSDREKVYQAEKELSYLRGRIAEIQAMKGIRNNETSEDKLSAIETGVKYEDKKLLELVREQMRSQYKKLHDTLAISQEKYDILKRKIYQQYRSRIIGVLTAKEKLENVSKLSRVEAVLERFVQGLANKSHKEAILSKEVRLKQEARKEAGTLKEKVGFLNQLLQNKRGYCSRDPVKVFGCANEPEWHDNILLQARILTYEAQNARLLQQISFFQSQAKDLQDQSKLYLDELELKESQITKLKKQVIEMDAANAKELMRRQEDIEQLQKRFAKMQEEGYSSPDKSNQEKEIALMRQEIQRKKDIIKGLKEKEKLLEQLIQSNRSSESSNKNRAKRDTFEEMRMQQSLREFKENNRELRLENSKLKEQISVLKEQITKKNALIKRSKGQEEQSRIKAVRQDHEQVDKLKSQIRSLKEELKASNGELEKLRKRRQKQVLELESQLKRLKNEFNIDKRSLESIVRALCDTIKRLYTDLDIMARKKGITINKEINFQQLIDSPGQIDSIKVYDSFQQVLKALKS